MSYLHSISSSCEGTVVHRLLSAKPRSYLRAMAHSLGVERGQNKKDTINNLIDAGCIKLVVEWQAARPSYKARVQPKLQRCKTRKICPSSMRHGPPIRDSGGVGMGHEEGGPVYNAIYGIDDEE